MISLSPAVRSLLDVLQFRYGVSFEVVDTALRPVQPAAPSAAGGLAQPGGTLAQPGVRERSLAALRSGESRVERGLPVPLALYPLRREREVVGLLIVAPRGGAQAMPLESRAATAPIDDDEIKRVEAAGQIAKAVVENDLTTSAQLAQAWDRARRLQGILRFTGQLAARDGERDLMQAVVQAASVWFDLDCRVYNREPGGDFALFAALPGIDRSEIKPRLERTRVIEMAAARRLSAAADLDAVGWHAKRGEVLVFAVGAGPDWVMLLTGVFEPEVELTFAAIAHVLEGELQQAASRRLGHWQQRLVAHTTESDVPPERALTELLEELAAAVAASGARLSVEAGGNERTLAVGGAAAAGPAVPDGPDAGRHARVDRIGPRAQMRLELWGREEAFGFQPNAVVEAWVSAVRPWISGTVLGSGRVSVIDDRIDELAFERRVQDEVERAKRFNLGLSLVLIDTRDLPAAEGLLEAIRLELRASDLMGRVRGGVLGVLLVHAGPDGAQSVAGRIRQRIGGLVDQTHRAAVRLGQAVFSADCQSGDALIQQALQRIGESNARG